MKKNLLAAAASTLIAGAAFAGGHGEVENRRNLGLYWPNRSVDTSNGRWR